MLHSPMFVVFGPTPPLPRGGGAKLSLLGTTVEAQGMQTPISLEACD